jgi:uncharacterized protein
LVLHTQHLATPNPKPTPRAILDLVTALGFVQVDTLHVVNRAHHLTLWARFGSYDVADVNKLLYSAKHRTLYEGWGHAASIIPLAHYRYHQWRSDRTVSYNPGFREWVKKPGNRALIARVLARVRKDGGLRVAEFEYDGPKRTTWYDWKPPKMALEALFARGDLMVTDRVNFQRVYDIKERVLPTWVETTPVPPDEGRRFCLEQAARALGVFEPRHLTFYAYMRATPAKALVRSLMEKGPLVKVRAETMHGVKPLLVHRDNLPLLERAADGDLSAKRTTFLAPFDSLFWAWKRDETLWGFKQLLECYKPESERVYGYFCLPILHRDRLVGRFDPKLDRASRVLTLNALYLEPGEKPDEELVTEIARAMRDFLAWHGATELRITKSDPVGFGQKLLRTLWS